MPHEVRATLNEATAALTGSSETPRLDAELLMAHALGTTREAMLLGGLSGETPEAFAALMARRIAHEPVAYILGTRDFWTVRIEVGPGVLVPRADSETLIEAACDWFADRVPATMLDLGTGPGTLLLAALDQWPDARGIGVERSAVARDYATRNAARIAPGRARIVAGDWASGIDARFDCVLANPPYVETRAPLPREVAAHEPHEALYAGADGLADYRRIVPDLPRLIAPGGVAILEIGASQSASVGALLEAQGFAVACRHDLAGRPRALVAHLPG